MKYLITGANGYLGQGITKELLQLGHEVIANDVVCSDVEPGSRIIEGNIFEIERPYQYFDEPDVLVHLAWRDGFNHESDAHFEDLPGHNRFIRKMIDDGIQRVCIMGSMHEVGFYEGSINERTVCNPMNQYGICKNALRQSIQVYAERKNVDFLWMRGFYIVSNSEKGSSVFSKIIRASKEGKKEFPFTTGQNQYDFLDYDLFCRYVGAAASQNRVTGIVNICSGYPEKLCDVVERFIADNHLDIRLKYGAFPSRPYDSKAIWGDNKKIQSILDTED